MGSIATTTNGTPFQQPSTTLLDRDPATGYLYCMLRSTTGTFDIYRSTDGSSWSLFLSTTRANVSEIGSIFISTVGWLHWVYRTNESSEDRIYWRRLALATSTWDTEVLAAHIPNGGVAGTVWTGLDMQMVVASGQEWIAIAAGTTYGGQRGVNLFGVYVPALPATAYAANLFAGSSGWYPESASSGRITPSLDIEHTGDGKTSSTPNLWVAFGRSTLNLAKLSWNGGYWTGPTSTVTLNSSIGADDSIAGRWIGDRFVVAVPNPSSTSTVVVYERNRANSSTTTRTTPTHPQGVVKHCTLSYNHSSMDVRVYAVGTTTAGLYYVDFIRATASWGSWTSVLADVVAGTNVDQYGARRGTYGDSKHHAYSARSSAPQTQHTVQGVAFPPNTPTWSAPTSGVAQDVGATLTLDWDFTDPDPADVQSAYAISRQIGAGTLAYWRASDSSWQATEQQNTSATSALTLASGWASGSDAAYTYKVKVWDASSVASGYSTGVVVVPSAKVNPTLSSPTAGGTVATAAVTATWTVSEQTAYQVTLVAADVLDSFSRTVADSWSTADTGETYTLVGTAANFDIASGVGTIQPGATSSDRIAVVTADAGTDRTVETTVKWAALPASGVLRAGVVARYVDSSNWYIGEISIATTGVVTVQATKAVAGVKTVLATYTHPTVYVGGVNWRIRAAVTGSRIQVKAWRAADSEPTSWQVDTTDTSITTGTLGGVWARNETAVTTHIASYDTFSSVSAPNSYDSGWVSSTSVTTLTPPTTLANGTAWNISVRTKNLEGLSSEWATAGFLVTYTPPATPTLVLSPLAAAGYITANITNPTPGGAQPALASQDLYRRVVGDTTNGVRVATLLSSGGTYNDWQAISGTAYEYRVLALGANGTTTWSSWTA